MDDFYYSIKNEKESEIKIKNSRFIGRTFKVGSQNSIISILEKIKKQEYSANHNCYAWTTGLFKERNFKYSDDGEPSGTAGKPIYDVISGYNLSNVLLIVTRYFGGTKLGTGGLVKAYGECAKKVIELSQTEKVFLTDTLAVQIDFSSYNLILQQLGKFEAVINESQFTDTVRLEIIARKSKSDAFIEMLAGLSNGRAKIEKK